MHTLLLPTLTELRRFWIPRTASGWLLYVALLALLLGIDALLKRFFPDLSKLARQIIEVVLLIIFLLILNVNPREM